MWLIKSDRLSIHNNDNNSNNFIGFVQWWFFQKPLQWDYVKTKMQYKHCKEYHEYSIMYYAYVICLNSIDLLKYTLMFCLCLCPRPVCRRFRPVCRQPRPVCRLLTPPRWQLGPACRHPMLGQLANNPKKFTDNLGRMPVVSYPAKTIRTQLVKSFRTHTNEVWVRNRNEKVVCVCAHNHLHVKYLQINWFKITLEIVLPWAF